MDKASAYGAGDCRFESCRGHYYWFGRPNNHSRDLGANFAMAESTIAKRVIKAEGGGKDRSSLCASMALY